MTRTILAWFDFETTGLDPTKGRILEYAVIFTDLNLRRLSVLNNIIKQDVDEARALMDEFCLNMHTQNGLLDEIEKAGLGGAATYRDHANIVDTVLAKVARDLKRKYSDYEDPVRIIAAGSNILFDVGYAMEHFPGFASELDHRPNLGSPTAYRVLDVSSYKMGFPEVFGAAESTSVAHRAMEDIEASIKKHQLMHDIVQGWRVEQANAS